MHHDDCEQTTDRDPPRHQCRDGLEEPETARSGRVGGGVFTMNLSEMKAALTEGGIQLTKSLGQNFLHDGNQLRRIVGGAELTAADSVLEIGPGMGPLTEQLMGQAGTVFAIEKDLRLVQFLQQRFAERLEPGKGLELLHGDALGYLKGTVRDWSGWKVVSNLPYSVASPILVELALAPQGPARIVTTLQLEVVRRLCAKEGQDDYGLLSLLVGLHYEAKAWFRIPASCFFPEPDVESGCVVLVRRNPLLLSGPELQSCFVKVVKTSFSQRRKMMLKLLRAQFDGPRLESAFMELGIPVGIRAERVSLGLFVQLTRKLCGKAPD